MKIKKGDNIIVRSGADKGKTGKVVRAFPKEGRVIIEGINMKKKHQRARRAGAKGQIIEFAAPLRVSTIALIDPKSGKATRVGFTKKGDKKIRIAKKSGAEI